jgi:hypothetical protein
MKHLISTLPNHIAQKINVCSKTSCWNFVGKDPSSNGYQRAWFKGIRSAAHRIVYNLLVDGVIEGKQLDHICCNRACCNPEHLQPVTHKLNCKLRDIRIKNGTKNNYSSNQASI